MKHNIRDDPSYIALRAKIKKQIKDAIEENIEFKSFLLENKAYGKYITDVTDYAITKVVSIKTIVERIKTYSNKSIIMDTLVWAKTKNMFIWRKLYNNKDTIKENK